MHCINGLSGIAPNEILDTYIIHVYIYIYCVNNSQPEQNMIKFLSKNPFLKSKS